MAHLRPAVPYLVWGRFADSAPLHLLWLTHAVWSYEAAVCLLVQLNNSTLVVTFVVSAFDGVLVIMSVGCSLHACVCSVLAAAGDWSAWSNLFVQLKAAASQFLPTTAPDQAGQHSASRGCCPSASATCDGEVRPLYTSAGAYRRRSTLPRAS